jgi:hypothetical protein
MKRVKLGVGLVSFLGLLNMNFVSSVLASSPAEMGKITGEVAFVEHRSFVSMVLCDLTREACVKPESYWSIVIKNDQTRYELNQAFEKGRTSRPESIEVGGVILHPGSRVSADVIYEPMDEAYSLITELKTIALLPTDLLEGRLMENMENRDDSTPTFGWLCSSASGENDTQIRLDVLHTREDNSNRLRVFAKAPESREFEAVAKIDHVAGEIRGDQVIYRGAQGADRLEVVIQTQPARLTPNIAVPAVLNFTKRYSSETAVIPLDTTVQLKCDQTRF